MSGELGKLRRSLIRLNKSGHIEMNDAINQFEVR